MSTRMTPRKVQQTCSPAPTRVASELQEGASGVSPTTVAERTDVGRCCCAGWKGGQRPATAAGRRTPGAEWAKSANILTLFVSGKCSFLDKAHKQLRHRYKPHVDATSSVISEAVSKLFKSTSAGLLWIIKNHGFPVLILWWENLHGLFSRFFWLCRTLLPVRLWSDHWAWIELKSQNESSKLMHWPFSIRK